MFQQSIGFQDELLKLCSYNASPFSRHKYFGKNSILHQCRSLDESKLVVGVRDTINLSEAFFMSADLKLFA